MLLFTPNALATMAGASLAVTIVTAVVKSVFGISGRPTQKVALIVALLLAGVFGSWTSPAAGLTNLLNAAVIYAAAMGIDQAVNYQK